MSDEHKDEADLTSTQLKKVLNEHGYGFQYAVLRRGELLRMEGKSKWSLVRPEFPVVARGKATHIDFVLVQQAGTEVFLIAECKRVNPGFSRWLFAREPYSTKNIVSEAFAGRDALKATQVTRTFVPQVGMSPYHIGLEFRTKQSSDCAPGRGAINEAVAQVLRGLGGFVNHVFHIGGSDLIIGVRIFVPVIFTTAELWTTEVDLSDADPLTGNLSDVQARRADGWIWFNHNRGADLRHDRPWSRTDDLRKGLEFDSTRSIAIVNAENIDRFLSANLDWLLDL